MTNLKQVLGSNTKTTPCALVGLPALMGLTEGEPEIAVALVDGSVAIDHPDLKGANIRGISPEGLSHCTETGNTAGTHGTFVAGILSARRSSAAPGICPGCTLVVRPIFFEPESAPARQPVIARQWPYATEALSSSSPAELATAIIESVAVGVCVINLSLGLTRLSPNGERSLDEALNHAAQHNVIVVAAAGNQATMGGSAITRHPWVIPVVACDLGGRPLALSNLGSSIGRYGLRAPGRDVDSLGAQDAFSHFSGTSVAAPFVTGAIALLWSLFPSASAEEVRWAITQMGVARRTSVIPPLLDAWAAYQTMLNLQRR